jgi:hypothetical protein
VGFVVVGIVWLLLFSGSRRPDDFKRQGIARSWVAEPDDRFVGDRHRGLSLSVDEHATWAAVDDPPLAIGGFRAQMLLGDLRIIDLHAGPGLCRRRGVECGRIR